MAAGTITLAFAALERVDSQTHFLEKWNPRKLPPVRDPNQIPRLSSAIEVVANLVFIVVFIGHASSLTLVNGPGLRITLAPVWINFFWGFLAVALLVTVFSVVNLIRPSWTGLRASARLVLDLVGGALWCWLMKAGIFAGFWIGKTPESSATDIAHAINAWAESTFPYSVVVVLVIVAIDLSRIFRLAKKHTGGMNGEVVAAL